ncbi:MAG: hypothetical protein HOE11_03285 [Candidatus Diapherotrites archaeon]|nr:hypothetical protein [Candidatus Diapherotrites archaeon]
MKKIIIKVGGNMLEDIREVWHNPEKMKGKTGTHTIYIKDPREIPEILSPQRLRMLIDVANNQHNISETAKRLGRKQEAISRDVKALEANGMIKKDKKGRETFLSTDLKKIEIQLC